MSFDYGPLRRTAESLIANFGKPATLRQITKTGDEWSPSISTEDTDITVVDTDQAIMDASGSLVARKKRTLFISTAAGVAPAKGDKVFVGWTKAQVTGLTPTEQGDLLHEIDRVYPLAPGPVTLLYEADLVI